MEELFKMFEPKPKQYVVITVTNEHGDVVAFNCGVDFEFSYKNTETCLSELEWIATTVYNELEYQDYLDQVAEFLDDDNVHFMTELNTEYQLV